MARKGRQGEQKNWGGGSSPVRPPVVVVAGPTASGKTRLALEIARRFQGEVVNADSMQIYDGLRILTARPEPCSQTGVPHHLFGSLDPARRGSVAGWQKAALAVLGDIHARGRLPVVTGGSGLYLKALMEGLAEIPEISPAERAASRRRLDEIGAEAFHRELQTRDPETAARLAPGDTQRLLRAYEVVMATGTPLSAWQAKTLPAPPHHFAVVVLDPPRAELHRAIEARFGEMMRAGAVEEVRALLARGLDPELPAMKALGVPALAAFLQGELSRREAVFQAIVATRQYAKRQATWFRHQLEEAPFRAVLRVGEKYSESLDEKIFTFIRQNLLTPDR
ncbi:MAG: tRNA (adenosine(37)-N6)-dimethylallyltransferase MiaA [Alphaproteobacteria bacterium]